MRSKMRVEIAFRILDTGVASPQCVQVCAPWAMRMRWTPFHTRYTRVAWFASGILLCAFWGCSSSNILCYIGRSCSGIRQILCRPFISIQQHKNGKSTDPLVLFEKKSKNQLVEIKSQNDVKKLHKLIKVYEFDNFWNFANWNLYSSLKM